MHRKEDYCLIEFNLIVRRSGDVLFLFLENFVRRFHRYIATGTSISVKFLSNSMLVYLMEFFSAIIDHIAIIQSCFNELLSEKSVRGQYIEVHTF